MVDGSYGKTPSLAKLFQDFGQRWKKVERVSRSTKWVAVQCDGSRHKFVWAHDLTTVGFSIEAAEREERTPSLTKLTAPGNFVVAKDCSRAQIGRQRLSRRQPGHFR